MLPDGRILIAFGDETLNWDATFTRLDSYDSLVTRYQIDRGRQVELDRTDTGRATIEISDTEGILDPTNSSGPFYNQIGPLLQVVIQRQNPVNGLWYPRYRGWIDELDYDFDPSQLVNRLTISLTDMFGILSVIEMLPGDAAFGVAPPEGSEDQIFFEDNTVQERINQILGDAGIPVDWFYVFSGNVRLWETVYSPGESVLSAIQEAAEAEFPGSPSNVAVDRTGRLFFRGRYAKFAPEDTEASQGEEMADNWDFLRWKAGDHAAVNADPVGTAHLRRFAFNRGLSHVINQAVATPSRAATGVPLTAAQQIGQQVQDSTSIGLRGIRSWSAQDLLTKNGLVAGGPDLTDLVETKRFASWYVAEYSTPRNRASDVAFRSMHPDWQGATKTWELMSKIDIGDAIQLTVSSPGGGGFDHSEFFVEGVHETCEPLNAYYDDVTVTLDLSPAPATEFPDAP